MSRVRALEVISSQGAAGGNYWVNLATLAISHQGVNNIVDSTRVKIASVFQNCYCPIIAAEL